jgi:hypothetical protein
MAERGRTFLVTKEQYEELASFVAKLPWYQAEPIMKIILSLTPIREEEQQLPLEPPPAAKKKGG